jgi:ribose transport system ATP-binding protein
MVGRELTNRYYRTDYGQAVSDEVVLTVDNVSVPGEIQNVSFRLHKGEILGIGGLSECGMHETGKAIFGASYGRSGSVTLKDGYAVRSIPGAISHSIAYASKDRDNESIIIADSIRDNICLPALNDMSRHGLLNNKKLDSFAQKNAELMSVKMTGIDQYVSALSGGNKQKVVISRWLGKDSDILVLDSPTRGIDVKVKADIYALMSELKQRGKSIIMISEELQELLGMSDRILIMKDGRINGEFLRNLNLGERDLITKMV